MHELLSTFTIVAVIGCGATGGVFFAFSAFVMKALARLPAAQGLAAMQSINVAAVTPIFMAVLFGAATMCALLAVLAFALWNNPGAPYMFAGSLLYLCGTVVVSIVFHVPRNDALAAIEPADIADINGSLVWTQYVRSWTAWNHLRTAAALGSSALLIAALHAEYAL